jgi:DNA-directed RNA polymerase subunit M/transcription elongation factor TFIIS
MKFCPTCETYLVSEILSSDVESDPNKLLLYKCYNCGHKEQINVSKDDTEKCIFKTRTEMTKIKIYSQNLKHLKYDRTLPHIDTINCPNEKCPTKNVSATDDDTTPALRNNVLYMNLNENMMIFLYQCCHCDYTWTNK